MYYIIAYHFVDCQYHYTYMRNYIHSTVIIKVYYIIAYHFVDCQYHYTETTFMWASMTLSTYSTGMVYTHA